MENKKYILLIVRNIGVLLWLIFQYSSTYFIAMETNELLQTLTSEARYSQDASSSQKRFVAEVIGYLKSVQQQIKKALLVGLLLYTTFTFPFFWPLQQYAVAVIGIIAMLASNVGVVYLKTSLMQNELKKATDTSDKLSAVLPAVGSTTAKPITTFQSIEEKGSTFS